MKCFVTEKLDLCFGELTYMTAYGLPLGYMCEFHKEGFQENFNIFPRIRLDYYISSQNLPRNRKLCGGAK